MKSILRVIMLSLSLTLVLLSVDAVAQSPDPNPPTKTCMLWEGKCEFDGTSNPALKCYKCVYADIWGNQYPYTACQKKSDPVPPGLTDQQLEKKANDEAKKKCQTSSTTQR